ncbi:hypothetical protein LI325_25765 [Enterocloster lavalensis]|nr:hypothetical protein [Enterocloster lavalensis]
MVYEKYIFVLLRYRGNADGLWRVFRGGLAAYQRHGGEVLAYTGGGLAGIGGSLVAYWWRIGGVLAAYWWLIGDALAAYWWRIGGELAAY